MNKIFLAVAACFVFFAACIQPPDYPKEPTITYLRMSKDTIRQVGLGSADSLLVTFSFTDGDGDLGFPEGDDTPSVIVIDSRDSFKDSLQLPYVEPQGAGNGISGEITIKLPTTCCIYIDPLNPSPPYACDEVTQVQYNKFFYSIKIRDRAGHESNLIQTDSFNLQCF